MAAEFTHDVFLSYSSKDEATVKPLAERLRRDGTKVWLGESEIKPGDSIPAKIEEGLEQSRVLVLCMSEHAFGSDWAALESHTFRFKDPLNHERRFIPLRLDDAQPKGSLAQFLAIDWRATADREEEYKKLLHACKAPVSFVPATEGQQGLVSEVKLHGRIVDVWCMVWSQDGTRALRRVSAQTMGVWDVKSGRCLREFEGHTGSTEGAAWSPDGGRAISGAWDKTVRLWDVDSGRCLRVFEGHTDVVLSVAWSPDGTRILSGSDDKTVRLWDVDSGRCLRVLEGHTDRIWRLAWSPDGKRALSASDDKTVRLWDAASGRCLRVLEGHTEKVLSVAWSPDGRSALSGADDTTVRMWDIESGRCLRVLEGHTADVWSVAWSPDGGRALSGSDDRTVRLWDIKSGRCLRVLEGHSGNIRSVAWSLDGQQAFSGDERGGMHVWDLPASSDAAGAGDGVLYTNAKVLVVGESGVGKTGLSRRMVADEWEPSDSTVGAWATQWKLPVLSDAGEEREIWLWDFGGQADQRLIHQLFMDETALAVLVFDGQKEDLFETLGQWDRDLSRAARKDFAKLLVAGRVDTGGLRVSRQEIEQFAAGRKFGGFLQTSAKTGLGCPQLRQHILDAINWDEIPCRTTKALFRRLKEEIIRLKDEGRVLMRINELRETLQLRLSGELERFTDDELRAVLTLLAGPGVVWELEFGSWVLLQPERINAYAQAVIRTLHDDEHQRGCVLEERVLQGELRYDSSMPRLLGDEERFVLLAMHQILVERGLCLRQPTEMGNLLVFPSFYRRERPDQVGHPAVLVSYRFTGFLDEVYATLVVRLHHIAPFDGAGLWRYAADFKTSTNKQLGVALKRLASGIGELEVYFDPSIAMEEKIIFSKYVREHLRQYARNVERFRHHVCSCGTPIGNRDVAMKRLNDWLQDRPPQPDTRKDHEDRDEPPSIVCANCEQRVPLWDDMEQCFADPKIQQRVLHLQKSTTIELTNQSKERALVGDVISTVALANQISRELTVSDHGIDMEIEFTHDDGAATGKKLYLQLKSGDSYLYERRRGGEEVYTIKNKRHAEYWMSLAFPVFLVVRYFNGEVRWMRIDEYLKRKSEEGAKPLTQIVFEGERFDVMAVRRQRKEAL